MAGTTGSTNNDAVVDASGEDFAAVDKGVADTDARKEVTVEVAAQPIEHPAEQSIEEPVEEIDLPKVEIHPRISDKSEEIIWGGMSYKELVEKVNNIHE